MLYWFLHSKTNMFLLILPEYKCAKRLPMTQQEKVINTVRWFKILWAILHQPGCSTGSMSILKSTISKFYKITFFNRNLDSFIGRTAHIQFLECQPLMKMLVSRYREFFLWNIVWIIFILNTFKYTNTNISLLILLLYLPCVQNRVKERGEVVDW